MWPAGLRHNAIRYNQDPEPATDLHGPFMESEKGLEAMIDVITHTFIST
jgi:hypothetical protein